MPFVQCLIERGAFSCERVFIVTDHLGGRRQDGVDISHLRNIRLGPITREEEPAPGVQQVGYVQCAVIERHVTGVALLSLPGFERHNIVVDKTKIVEDDQATDAYIKLQQENAKLREAHRALVHALIGAKVDYDRIPYQLGDDGCERLKRAEDGWYVLDGEAVKDIADWGLDPFYDAAHEADQWRQSYREAVERQRTMEHRLTAARAQLEEAEERHRQQMAHLNAQLQALNTQVATALQKERDGRS